MREQVTDVATTEILFIETEVQLKFYYQKVDSNVYQNRSKPSRRGTNVPRIVALVAT